MIVDHEYPERHVAYCIQAVSSTETSPVAWQTSPIYVVWDVDGTVRAASPSYAALVNLPVDEVVGRVWPDLVVGEEAIGWQQLRLSVETLRAAPVVVVDMPTTATGDTRWLRWTEWAVRDATGALVEVHSTAIDVTELHEARDALASVFETVVAARAQGRQEVVEQLHNGAVQQLVAARWALGTGDADAARILMDDALSAVRSSMETLDQPVPPAAGPPSPPFWQQVPTAAR
ncbi:MAG: fold, partial [Actinomycetota bacterium]